MHDRLFRTEVWIVDTNWTREAAASGVRDTLDFQKCLKSERAAARLEEDLQLAARLNIAGTPAFLYRTGFHEGVIADSTVIRVASRSAR